MALQSLPGAGLWVPAPFSGYTVAATTYVLDADTEKAVLVCRAPKAGILDRFDFNLGAVTNSPENGLRASFQGVNVADGQNDGTILGATNSAAVTYAHSVTTGWKNTNFAETVTVTRGQLIACVVDWAGAFTAGDSVALSHVVAGIVSGLPYGLSVVGTKNPTNLPIIALHYTDGYAFLSPGLPGIDTATSITYNSGTGTADEWGMAFQVPFPCTLNQVMVTIAVAAGADFEVVVYGPTNTILATMVHDGDVTGGTLGAPYHALPDAAVTLAANTTYRVTVRPTTANNIGMFYNTFQSADLMHTVEGGDDFYMTSRLNQAGAWTDYNSGTFRRPRISLHLTANDDGAGGGRRPRLVTVS